MSRTPTQTNINIENNGSKEDSFEEKVTKFHMEQELKKNEHAMKLEGNLYIADALQQSAAASKDLRANKEAAWERMTTAFAISKKDMRNIRTQGILRSVVNMLYLLIIVGCELDLYGFMMAYQTYWFMGYTIVNVLLILAPVGYLLAIFLYMSKNKDGNEPAPPPPQEANYKLEIAARCHKKGKNAATKKETKTNTRSSSARGFTELKGKRTPIKLEYYHFLPVLRYYLVIKDKTMADVEGIFRVNSLSSFTLGIAQIISIVFQVLVDGGPMSIFVKINIGSQIINWVITILYFVTPISDMMSASIKISALTSNSKDQLRDIKEQYMNESAKGAFINDMGIAKEIQRFVDLEIRFIGGFEDEDLSQYPMELKFKALRLLREKQLNGYAEI